MPVAIGLHSFYCMVILTVLFSSSCFWQPVPLSTPLASPIPVAQSSLESHVILSQTVSTPNDNTSDNHVAYLPTFGAAILYNLTVTYPDALSDVDIVFPEEREKDRLLGFVGTFWKKKANGGLMKDVETLTGADVRPRFTLPSTITLSERCWCGIASASSYTSSYSSPASSSPDLPTDTNFQTVSERLRPSIFDPTSPGAWERATLDRVCANVGRRFEEFVRAVREERERQVNEATVQKSDEQKKDWKDTVLGNDLTVRYHSSLSLTLSVNTMIILKLTDRSKPFTQIGSVA